MEMLMDAVLRTHPGLNHRTLLAILMLMASLGAAPALAKPVATEASPASTVDKPAVKEAKSSPDASMEIKIETSRPQPSAGSGLGFTAEFRNTSERSVLYLSNETTTLTLPPEVEGPLAPMYGRTAFFPTENDQMYANDARPAKDRRPIVIAIQPGKNYRAAWVINKKAEESADAKFNGEAATNSPPWWNVRARVRASKLWQQISGEVGFLFFVPGDYKVLVQAKVGVNAPPSTTEFDYYTFSETAVVKIGAPQFVIIVGAMLGGLVCVFLFPHSRPKSVTVAFRMEGTWAAASAAWSWLYSVAGACLLSAIVTILLARLSESQFLVKISVNDFWGAVVVGFIAQYAGVSILDKLIPSRAKAREEALKGTGGSANTQAATATSADGKTAATAPTLPAASP
jgi:hypothetical protein